VKDNEMSRIDRVVKGSYGFITNGLKM